MVTSSSPSPRWRGEGCLGSGSWAGEEAGGEGARTAVWLIRGS